MMTKVAPWTIYNDQFNRNVTLESIPVHLEPKSPEALASVFLRDGDVTLTYGEFDEITKDLGVDAEAAAAKNNLVRHAIGISMLHVRFAKLIAIKGRIIEFGENEGLSDEEVQELAQKMIRLPDELILSEDDDLAREVYRAGRAAYDELYGPKPSEEGESVVPFDDC